MSRIGFASRKSSVRSRHPPPKTAPHGAVCFWAVDRGNTGGTIGRSAPGARGIAALLCRVADEPPADERDTPSSVFSAPIRDAAKLPTMGERRSASGRKRSDAEQPGERLRLELTAPASPRHVAETALMFQDALASVAPHLAEGAVTLVIRNRDLRSELRGYGPAGCEAVADVGDLLENPTRKVQKKPGLYFAATSIAKRLDALTAYEPRVFRGASRIPVATLGVNYVKSLRAIGEALQPPEGQESIRGETVVFSQVLRFGRKRENGPLTIRIRFGGSHVEVAVADSQAEICAELTVSGKQVPLRVAGKWAEGPRGYLELSGLSLVSVDRTFEAWTGEELAEHARRQAASLSEDDFSRMLQRLRDIRGD